MILENGVVRTLDPSLPVARALAIAGDRVAGGVGTHETALATPEIVDLGGRCVLPGFTDSHVHFPTWAVAQDEVRLEDTRSVDEALARVRAKLDVWSGGGWLRGWARLRTTNAVMRAIESRFSGTMSLSSTVMPKVCSTKPITSSTPVESITP